MNSTCATTRAGSALHRGVVQSGCVARGRVLRTVWEMLDRLQQPIKVLYPPIRNQPFGSKGVPTPYATGMRLTDQADDNLVPCGNRFGRLSAGNRGHPVPYARRPATSGEAHPCCCVPLSLFRPTGLLLQQTRNISIDVLWLLTIACVICLTSGRMIWCSKHTSSVRNS